MLGHAFRLDPDLSAQNALMFAVVGSGHLRRRHGHHKTNLLDNLWKDLNAPQLSLRTHNDILRLRDLAGDRLSWNTLYYRDWIYSTLSRYYCSCLQFI